MRRHAKSDRHESRCDEIADVRGLWQHECKRARPKTSRDEIRQRQPLGHLLARLFETGDVHDERIETRALFQIEDGLDALGTINSRRKPVDGFRRHSDALALIEMLNEPRPVDVARLR